MDTLPARSIRWATRLLVLLGAAAPLAGVACTPAGQSGAVGYLAGRASIGPLQPVQRVGAPTPTPSPAVCTSRGLVVFASDTGAEMARVAFGPDCTYRLGLPPGSYRVELERQGIDSSRDLPRTLTIVAGQTTILDVSIDTGMR